MSESRKGKKQPVGATYTSQNGYHYTKVDNNKWRLTHQLVMEREIGRPLIDGERVRFKDRDKTNLSPENLEVIYVKGQTLMNKLAKLEAKKDEIDAQIAILREELLAQRAESN